MRHRRAGPLLRAPRAGEPLCPGAGQAGRRHQAGVFRGREHLQPDLLRLRLHCEGPGLGHQRHAHSGRHQRDSQAVQRNGGLLRRHRAVPYDRRHPGGPDHGAGFRRQGAPGDRGDSPGGPGQCRAADHQSGCHGPGRGGPGLSPRLLQRVRHGAGPLPGPQGQRQHHLLAHHAQKRCGPPEGQRRLRGPGPPGRGSLQRRLHPGIPEQETGNKHHDVQLRQVRHLLLLHEGHPAGLWQHEGLHRVRRGGQGGKGG